MEILRVYGQKETPEIKFECANYGTKACENCKSLHMCKKAHEDSLKNVQRKSN